MNKFHSTVSRRDFMKGLGLAGAGLGAAAAAAPVFHDLDEVIASPGAAVKRPWYIKTGLDEPTTEVDWSQTQRYAEGDTTRGKQKQYYDAAFGDGANAEVAARGAANKKNWLLANKKGWSLKDYALANGIGVRLDVTHVGAQKSATPEKLGVPKWQGTPEEAANMLRAAAKVFGAGTIGFVELEPNRAQKLIYSYDPGYSHKIVFEDVEQGYETNDGPVGMSKKGKRVIPNKVRYAIVYNVQMSPEMFKRAPSRIAGYTNSHRYYRSRILDNAIKEFLRSIGYQGLGYSPSNGLGIAPAFGVMAGLGEVGRINRLIAPEYGPLTGSFLLVTDLPLATDKPIDAGFNRFCYTCKKCAENCPAGNLSFDTEPTWDTNKDMLITPAGWHNPGHKAWFENSPLCFAFIREYNAACCMCFGACTFTKDNEASIHDLTAAALATTSIFNGFLRVMDDVMGYGLIHPFNPNEAREKYDFGNQEGLGYESWWDLNLPMYGIDSTVGTRGAGDRLPKAI